MINTLNIAARKKFAQPVEILESAIQNALSAKKLSIDQVFAVFRALKRAKKNRHAVAPQFKENIADRLLNFAQDYLDKGAPKYCLDLLEMAEALDVPPNKKFLLLQSKADRLLRLAN